MKLARPAWFLAACFCTSLPALAQDDPAPKAAQRPPATSDTVETADRESDRLDVRRDGPQEEPAKDGGGPPAAPSDGGGEENEQDVRKTPVASAASTPKAQPRAPEAPTGAPKAAPLVQPHRPLATGTSTLGTTVVPAPAVSYVPGFVATLSVLGEVDTNARRVAIDPKAPVDQNPEVVADALMRGQLSLVAGLIRPKQRFNLRLDAGGKLFSGLATERMGVAQLQSNVDVVVAPAVALYGRLFSKVRAQVSLARSYTIHRADVGASIAIFGPLSIRPSLYGAGFHGVGTPQFSSASSGMGLGASWRLSTQERADFSGDLGLRAYPFAYPVDEEGRIVGGNNSRRIDMPLRATIAFSSARLLFINVSYTLLRNGSNSFGESFTRHRLRALVGARLPALVTLSAQGSLQITTYDQGVSVGQRLFLADDDESQNVLQIKLSRPLLTGIAVEGRVAFFGNELAREGVRFSRTTLSVGIRADL